MQGVSIRKQELLRVILKGGHQTAILEIACLVNLLF